MSWAPMRLRLEWNIATMASDTSPEAAAIQAEIFRRMTPEERLRIALELSEEMRNITLAGLRSRHPEMSEEELRRELIREWYGIVLPIPKKSGAP